MPAARAATTMVSRATGRDDDGLAGEQELGAFRGALRLQVRGIVLGAEGDAHHALGGGGDLVGVDHAQSALDGRHDERAAHAAEFGLDLDDLGLEFADLVGGLGLRHADHVDTGLDDGLDVLAAVRRAQRVDADHHFGAAEVDGFQGVMDEQTRGVLLGHGHGVLEVQHDGVGTVDMRIGHHSRVVAGNEHHRSPQSFHTSFPVARTAAAVTRARMVQSRAPLSVALT